MSLHLAEISQAVKEGAHAVVILDQAGWHSAKTLQVPDNITLREPAGLTIKDGILYLSDHGTGGILGFDLEGNLIDWINTERGSDALGGIDFGPDGAMYVTDVNANEILRFSAK